MKKNFKILFFLVFIVFLSSCDEDSEDQIVEPVVQEEGLYFPPINSDQWETKSVEKLEWDPVKLQQAVDFAQQKNSYSLIILHKGRIVAEHYFNGADKNSQYHVESVAKSITSFLMGIMQEKYSLDINEKVSTYLGPGWSKAPKAKEDLITVKHLLTMTSGLDYELNYLEDAGTLWYYSNAAYEVLFKLYEKLASSNVVDFSTENLFSKIGMTNSLWNGAQLSSNARDLARFGLMILAKGKWEENSLTNNKVYFDDMLATSQPLQEAYGYLWWLNGKPTYYDEHTIFNGPIYPAMPTDALLAMGRHDQRIEIIPSLDLVVVRQGDATLLPELGEESFDNQFWTLLLQAIKNNA